jgi:hypothetical protein
MLFYIKKTQAAVDNNLEQIEECPNFDDETSDDLNFQPEVSAMEDPETKNNLDQNQAKQKDTNKDSFVDGLGVGLGLGSIACFAIVWASLFFSPASSISYI